ncbi:MAG: hypothetical protein ABIZ81_03205 [Opitutaceae bacterium]
MRSFKSNRGSVLITAMIFAAVIAISLGSFFKLSMHTTNLANRSFYLNAAQNLVDIGFERAIWALNDSRQNPPLWTRGGFSSGGGGYQATFPSAVATDNYVLSGGATGKVKVWTELLTIAATSTDPAQEIWHTVAQATVTLGDNVTKITKTAECWLQERSYSEGGMIARNGIEFVGNTMVDSWKSRPAPSDDRSYAQALLATAYTDLGRRAEAQIASPALISLLTADVFGRATIGTPDASGITVSNNQGRLAGIFTAGPGIDSSRLFFNFSSSFPDVPDETSLTSRANINGNTTLFAGRYTMTSIDIQNTEEIQIAAGATVVLVVTGDVDLKGQAKIIIPSNSRLTMLVGGDFKMAGGTGILNGSVSAPNNPDRFTLLGTRKEAQILGGTAMQDWVIVGGGFLSCVIYAPNASINVNGGANTYGSIVANFVRMVGGGNFHQDESLSKKRISGLWGPVKWRDLLTPAERAAYAAQLTF